MNPAQEFSDQTKPQLNLRDQLGVAAKAAIQETRQSQIQTLELNKDAWGVTDDEYTRELNAIREQADLLLEAIGDVLASAQ